MEISEYIKIDPIVLKVLLALAFGAVIGLEREINIQRTGIKDFGGIRTYSFVAVLGAVSAYLGPQIHQLFPLVGFLGVMILVSIAYYANRMLRTDKIGMTGEMTALLAYTLGILCMLGHTFIALATTIFVITILALRSFLHSFAKNLGNNEIFASIKFGIIAFIILPLLPDTALDPWGAINPHKTWFIIVLISGVNFLGYALNRFMGARKGTALAGFMGGFVSSTAVNLSMTQRSKEGVIPVPALLIGTLLAQCSSFMMTALEIYILNKQLFSYIAVPLFLSSVLVIGYAYIHRKSTGDQEVTEDYELKLRSPFTLSSALILGSALTGVILVMKILSSYVGNAGMYITGAISGAFALDATAIAMAQTAGDSITYADATRILMLAIMMSIVQKIVVVWSLGSREFAIKSTIFFITIASLLVGFAWVM